MKYGSKGLLQNSTTSKLSNEDSTPANQSLEDLETEDLAEEIFNIEDQLPVIS